MSDSARCMWMRGGTSKGGYFLAEDLPADTARRDAFLLAIMGSPDPTQIDGMGGGDPLRSKVAVVSASNRKGVDVDYLFLQVSVDEAAVSDAQNCGNILAGVAAFAVERKLVDAGPETTSVVVHMKNTGQTATCRINTPNGLVTYAGDTAIDGVPGTASAVAIEFHDTAGSVCGALLPTGNATDIIDAVEVTLIDNGMPCVIMRASDMGLTGEETRAELDANTALKTRLEAIRLKAGPMMNLGDVATKTVPKMCMVSSPKSGGAISTRTFIPHRCHASIGVLGAVTVATACMLKASVAKPLARIDRRPKMRLDLEHPSGKTGVEITLDKNGNVAGAAIVRTARKLFDGIVYGH